MITLENVRLRFDGRGIAGLSGVSFKLKKGSITALMGPNGSGKTTILKVLAGQLNPDSGTVTKEGSVLMAQSPVVDSAINVQKYLLSKAPLEVPEEKKIQLTRDLADIFEFTFQLRQKMGELSAGQKQKVLLAGELITNPKIILLDEPFAHLDPHTRIEILKSLFEYVRRQELTLLWVTHDLSEASRFSDQLLLIQHGKIEQAGTPEEVITAPVNIFAAQFVGHHNFFPVKKSDGKWKTPWGDFDFKTNKNLEEAYLVVPDTSWEFVKESPVFGKVEAQYFRETMRTIEVQTEDRTLTIQGHFPSQKLGQTLYLKAKLQECFLIQL